MSLYLNDIPLDTFLKYFNSNNLSKAGNWNYVKTQATSKLYIHNTILVDNNINVITKTIYTYDNKLITNNDTNSSTYISDWLSTKSLGLEGTETVTYTDKAIPVYYSAIYAKYAAQEFYISPAPYSLLTYEYVTLPTGYFYYNGDICTSPANEDGNDLFYNKKEVTDKNTGKTTTVCEENGKYKNINLIKYIGVKIDAENKQIKDFYTDEVLYSNINLYSMSQTDSDYYDSKHINHYAESLQFEQFKDNNNSSYILYKNNPIEKYDSKTITVPTEGFTVGHTYVKMRNSQTNEEKYFDADEIPDSTFNRYINLYRKFRSAKYKSDKYTIADALKIFDYNKPVYVEADSPSYLLRYHYKTTYTIRKLAYAPDESIYGNLIAGYSKSQFKYSSLQTSETDGYVMNSDINSLEQAVHNEIKKLQSSDIYCRNPQDPEDFYIATPTYEIIGDITISDDNLNNIEDTYTMYTSKTSDEYVEYYVSRCNFGGRKPSQSTIQKLKKQGIIEYNSKIDLYKKAIKQYYIDNNRYFILSDYTGTKLDSNDNYAKSAGFAISNYMINDQDSTRYTNDNKLDPNYIYCRYYHNKALFKLYTQKGLKNDNNLNTGTCYRVDDTLNYGFIKKQDFSITNDIIFDDTNDDVLSFSNQQTTTLDEIANSDNTNLYTRLVEYEKFPLNIDRYNAEYHKSEIQNAIATEKITIKPMITKTEYSTKFNNVNDSIPAVVRYLCSLYEFTCKSTDDASYTQASAEFYNFKNYNNMNTYARTKDTITEQNTTLEKYKMYYGNDAVSNKKIFDVVLKYKILNSLNLNTSTDMTDTTKEDDTNGESNN